MTEKTEQSGQNLMEMFNQVRKYRDDFDKKYDVESLRVLVRETKSCIDKMIELTELGYIIQVETDSGAINNFAIIHNRENTHWVRGSSPGHLVSINMSRVKSVKLIK